MENQEKKNLTEEQKKKLQEIANKTGTTVNQLIDHSKPEDVISNYKNGNYGILNEAAV